MPEVGSDFKLIVQALVLLVLLGIGIASFQDMIDNLTRLYNTMPILRLFVFSPTIYFPK